MDPRLAPTGDLLEWVPAVVAIYVIRSPLLESRVVSVSTSRERLPPETSKIVPGAPIHRPFFEAAWRREQCGDGRRATGNRVTYA